MILVNYFQNIFFFFVNMFRIEIWNSGSMVELHQLPYIILHRYVKIKLSNKH